MAGTAPVVCSATLLGTWEREIARFAPAVPDPDTLCVALGITREPLDRGGVRTLLTPEETRRLAAPLLPQATATVPRAEGRAAGSGRVARAGSGHGRGGVTIIGSCAEADASRWRPACRP
ncbi:hypothetical protein [Streptomyces shenzhenensis]|uniref:hypothetical protein n=1 Tax=Streptomyces shenzhenensis TaxID=943815 RepID=UPI003684519C